MEYYKMKREAQQDIYGMVERNESIARSVVMFKVTQKYGLGATFVNNYLALLESMGIIRIEQDTLINRKLEEKNKKDKNGVPN